MPPLQWYFLPQFLGFVLAGELDTLREVHGFQECDCPFCADSMMNDATFNAMAAGGHFLWWCARLANEFNGAGASLPAILIGRLTEALQFWSEVQEAEVVLDNRSRPTHLATWIQVVS